MAAPIITDPKLVMPTEEDFKKLLKSKILYEAAQKIPTKDAWNKANFGETPWGIAYLVSIGKYKKAMASYNKVQRKGQLPQQKVDIALRYLIVAIAIDWKELIDQLKTAIKNWGYTSTDLKNIAVNVWNAPGNAEEIAKICSGVEVDPLEESILVNSISTSITESVEKHSTLNSKLFTKEEVLKDKVRDKMLEIVDEFLADLKEQSIKIKVDDILIIGSNASYNYTKDSDIDLHIVTNSKAVDYDKDIADALYGAYRTLFNKSLDIKLFDIPLELYVETEDCPRTSNGIYSVKNNKWVKKPVAEDIPDYDTKTLDELVSKWETKCKDLIDDIEADKLDDETKVVKMIEDIYEKLRKKGISKGEYAEENLAFKELRNKGYLDQLKDYKNKLVTKRLSLEEKLDKQRLAGIYNKIASIAGTQPIVQNNGMFFIYNIKASDAKLKAQALKQLPFVEEVYVNESGKYDFTSPLDMAMNRIPEKYYNIRGMLNI